MKHDPLVSGYKICNKCGEPKHALAFASDSEKKDGVKNACRQCDGKESYARRKRRINQPLNLIED
jgi:hypothetical protein